jgi:hypothetical protein
VIVPNNHWSTCKNITAICTVNFYVEKYRRNTEQWRLETNKVMTHETCMPQRCPSKFVRRVP